MAIGCVTITYSESCQQVACCSLGLCVMLVTVRMFATRMAMGSQREDSNGSLPRQWMY